MPVQGGDVQGAYVVTDWVAILGTASSLTVASVPEPMVGQTITVPGSFSFDSIDESATLVPSAQLLANLAAGQLAGPGKCGPR
jgi:hypothetical protein